MHSRQPFEDPRQLFQNLNDTGPYYDHWYRSVWVSIPFLSHPNQLQLMQQWESVVNESIQPKHHFGEPSIRHRAAMESERREPSHCKSNTDEAKEFRACDAVRHQRHC